MVCAKHEPQAMRDDESDKADGSGESNGSSDNKGRCGIESFHNAGDVNAERAGGHFIKGERVHVAGMVKKDSQADGLKWKQDEDGAVAVNIKAAHQPVHNKNCLRGV